MLARTVGGEAMRPVLLAVLGGLLFLMTFTLACAIIGLDPWPMRALLAAVIGYDPELRFTPMRPSPQDLLAYLLSAAAAGAVVRWLGRLMYRHV